MIGVDLETIGVSDVSKEQVYAPSDARILWSTFLKYRIIVGI